MKPSKLAGLVVGGTVLAGWLALALYFHVTGKLGKDGLDAFEEYGADE